MCNKSSTISTRHLLITQVVSYNAPFFTTWFSTNWMVLFFPLYFIFCLISTKCESPGNILQESVRNFRVKGFTAGKFKKHFSLNAIVAQSKNCPFVVNTSFIHLFYIPLIFTDVELVIYIVSIVGKQVYTVVSYCNITVSIADKISIHRFCLNVVS